MVGDGRLADEPAAIIAHRLREFAVRASPFDPQNFAGAQTLLYQLPNERTFADFHLPLSSQPVRKAVFAPARVIKCAMIPSKSEENTSLRITE